MKLISSENIVFVPLKVKHLQYLKEHFSIMSGVSSSLEPALFLSSLFSKLLNTLDIL